MQKIFGTIMALAAINVSAAPSKDDVVLLPVPTQKGQLAALHCKTPQGKTSEAILFIHGASFPTELSAGFEFAEHDSWMDFVASRGLLACGLDFVGYGASTRPPAMSRAPEGVAPLMRATEAAAQIATAAGFLRNSREVQRLHLVAHSWGTIAAATFASQRPEGLASLTLFGPVVPTKNAPTAGNTDYAWWSITARQRYEQLRFEKVLPKGMHLLEKAVDRSWIEQFEASQSAELGAGEVIRIPAGSIADIGEAKAGKYPYRPQDVAVPIFVVYGDYDNIVDDACAEKFLSGFSSSPLKWRMRIDHGTHVMHLESSRWSLYRSVAAFIDQVEARDR